ncbi:LOW QUALITY PROTEIN: scale keratin [Haliaeetus albicilla]
MSCYSEFCRPCGVTCPQPIAKSYNEPCVQQCPDSRVVIFPMVTVPGPILSSFPQESIVGSSGPAWSGSSFSSQSSWGYGGSLGLGSYGGYGSSLGLGGSSGYGGSQGYGSPFGLRGYGGYGRSLGYGCFQGYGDDMGYGSSLGCGGQHGSSGFGNFGRSYSSGFSSSGMGYYLPGAQRWGRSRCRSCGAF